jgi:hypothetical protein
MLAITEISWLRPDPPDEVRSFWTAEYPGMRSVEQNLEILRATNYRELGHFSLPTASWWTDYYNPILARLPELLDKYRHDPAALDILAATQKEIEMYRKYSDWYGYVFYLAQAN